MTNTWKPSRSRRRHAERVSRLAFVGLVLLAASALPLLADCFDCDCCGEASGISLMSSGLDGCCSGNSTAHLTAADLSCAMIAASPEATLDATSGAATDLQAPVLLRSAFASAPENSVGARPVRHEVVPDWTAVDSYLLHQAFLL